MLFLLFFAIITIHIMRRCLNEHYIIYLVYHLVYCRVRYRYHGTRSQEETRRKKTSGIYQIHARTQHSNMTGL